eukprot:12075626-Alexandrium_andersonii.AAC.1
MDIVRQAIAKSHDAGGKAMGNNGEQQASPLAGPPNGRPGDSPQTSSNTVHTAGEREPTSQNTK